MIILINSSKTMQAKPIAGPRKPQLLDKAVALDAILKDYSIGKLKSLMHLSQPLAVKTHELIAGWSANGKQSIALDTFKGDIYRGLRAEKFTQADRQYADSHLIILSGLYGAIKPLDGVQPYRCEMIYQVKTKMWKNVYEFWSNSIAGCIPDDQIIINLASVEYSKTVTAYIDEARIVSPQFLTQKQGSSTFVTVHGKVARGRFARWMIKNKVNTLDMLKGFNDAGYAYNAELSTPTKPVFVTKEYVIPS